MTLVERTLFGDIDMVQVAIDRLREFEPAEGYYGAFSGGKDSCVIKALADLADVQVDWHYNVSGIDPPELIRFIKEYHPDVDWERFDVPFLIKMRTQGFPLRQGRWCCEVYKEAGGKGRVVLTGVRRAESNRRAKRQMVEACYNSPGKRFLHVIIDWREVDVWDFIRGEKIPYCSLYDEGWSRIGCIAYCMQSAWLKRKELDRYPSMERAYIRAFEALYALRKSQGNPSVDRWGSGREMFDWWLSNEPAPKDSEGGLFD